MILPPYATSCLTHGSHARTDNRCSRVQQVLSPGRRRGRAWLPDLRGAQGAPEASPALPTAHPGGGFPCEERRALADQCGGGHTSRCSCWSQAQLLFPHWRLETIPESHHRARKRCHLWPRMLAQGERQAEEKGYRQRPRLQRGIGGGGHRGKRPHCDPQDFSVSRQVFSSWEYKDAVQTGGHLMQAWPQSPLAPSQQLWRGRAHHHCGPDAQGDGQNQPSEGATRACNGLVQHLHGVGLQGQHKDLGFSIICKYPDLS